MRTTWIAAAAALAVTASLVACGGGAAPSATAPSAIDEAPVTQSDVTSSPPAIYDPTADETGPVPTYTDPAVMLAKVRAAGFCQKEYTADGQPKYDYDDQPSFNVWGGVSVTCSTGAAHEMVSLDVYPTAAAEQSYFEEPNKGNLTVYYFGPGWGLATQSPATMIAVRAALSK
jgi:hypothetical protein